MRYLVAGAALLAASFSASVQAGDYMGWYLGAGIGYGYPIKSSGEGHCSNAGGKVLEHKGKLYCTNQPRSASHGGGSANAISGQHVGFMWQGTRTRVPYDPDALTTEDVVVEVVGVALPNVGVTVRNGDGSGQTHTYDKGGVGLRGLKAGDYTLQFDGPSLVAAVDSVAPGSSNGILHAYLASGVGNPAPARVSFSYGLGLGNGGAVRIDTPYCRECSAAQGMSVGLNIPKGGTRKHPTNARVWLTYEATPVAVAAQQPATTPEGSLPQSAAAPEGSLPPSGTTGVDLGLSTPTIVGSVVAAVVAILLLSGTDSSSTTH